MDEWNGLKVDQGGAKKVTSESQTKAAPVTRRQLY